MIANEELRIWGIHTTDDSLFLHDNVVAIGWKEFGDCSKLEATREAYKNHYIKSYPDSKKGAVATSAGMLYMYDADTAYLDDLMPWSEDLPDVCKKTP